MNRRDFLKSLSALGLYPALPSFALPKAEWPGRLGRITGLGCYGIGEESGRGAARLWRGESLVNEWAINVLGGLLSWDGRAWPIIYTNDMKLEVDPFVVAHTVVHPIGGGESMYWGAEYINGKSVETWLPLNA